MAFGLEYLRLPFRQAIKFLRARINVPTDNFRQTLGLDFRAVFAVASARGALLSELRRAVDGSIERGESLDTFRQNFRQIATQNGWPVADRTGWRSQIIWQTNLRTAHAAGRTEQMLSVTNSRPYWWWRHGRSNEPRPAHKALDGWVIRHDDPFWSVFDCPHGFGCRCTKISLSERDLKRLKLTPKRGPKEGEKIGGHPLLREPGWGSHAPITPEARAEAINSAASRMTPAIARRFRAEVARLTENPSEP